MRLGITWRQKLGKPECPYLERWVLNLGPLGSIRLHHWIRSDDKRAMHDHPADFITLVLKGRYTDISALFEKEKIPRSELSNLEQAELLVSGGYAYRLVEKEGQQKLERMTPGKIQLRKAEHRHIVSVDPGGCWTLLYFFPDRRKWGFYRPRKSDGKLKFVKSNKYFLEEGHHPCDQP